MEMEEKYRAEFPMLHEEYYSGSPPLFRNFLDKTPVYTFVDALGKLNHPQLVLDPAFFRQLVRERHEDKLQT